MTPEGKWIFNEKEDLSDILKILLKYRIILPEFGKNFTVTILTFFKNTLKFTPLDNSHVYQGWIH